MSFIQNPIKTTVTNNCDVRIRIETIGRVCNQVTEIDPKGTAVFDFDLYSNVEYTQMQNILVNMIAGGAITVVVSCNGVDVAVYSKDGVDVKVGKTKIIEKPVEKIVDRVVEKVVKPSINECMNDVAEFLGTTADKLQAAFSVAEKVVKATKKTTKKSDKED